MATTFKTTLTDLSRDLAAAKTIPQKLKLLMQDPLVEAYLKDAPQIEGLSSADQVILYSVIAAGQQQTVLLHEMKRGMLFELLDALRPVETFYREIGGIVGYQAQCLSLLRGADEDVAEYEAPQPTPLFSYDERVQSLTIEGLKRLDEMAEFYPLGGAADRLSLRNRDTGSFQTAATLSFFGYTLLERMVRDVQGREYLAYKLFGKQVRVPLVIMTSFEKGNDAHVREMFEEKEWFGRNERDFFLFSQPLVPAMDTEGKWCLSSTQLPLLKPGGHGALWKLARDRGALEWLHGMGKKKALVRQINNPIAGVDYGLLAFTGIGLAEDRTFGFASCPRKAAATEGINVVRKEGDRSILTNIEYCHPAYSQFTEGVSNTNLLFVDLDKLEEMIVKDPIPGMLVNAKPLKYFGVNGELTEKTLLRLESTMQNIADVSEDSFITVNHRGKTISTIKRFLKNEETLQTPEHCLYDLLCQAHELLSDICGWSVPKVRKVLDMVKRGPSFLFSYHPALGPLYDVIKEKLIFGTIKEGSELTLEIAEVQIEGLHLDGRLLIIADCPMGHKEGGEIIYSDRAAKCTLTNVRVENTFGEECSIAIEEGGELIATNVTFFGDVKLRVPENTRVIATQKKGQPIELTRSSVVA